ncbi:hypothetical protein ABGB09_21650 [Streptomyces sp. B8F3]|uniref:hypothetical protein n=1 Tax=Streptomyces sp. B8F3 TaxID=3153573 RepID=UPI00325DD273
MTGTAGPATAGGTVAEHPLREELRPVARPELRREVRHFPPADDVVQPRLLQRHVHRHRDAVVRRRRQHALLGGTRAHGVVHLDEVDVAPLDPVGQHVEVRRLVVGDPEGADAALLFQACSIGRTQSMSTRLCTWTTSSGRPRAAASADRQE